MYSCLMFFMFIAVIYKAFGDASYHFCAVCRMTRSVYTLCGFEKNKPVGFCAFCEIRGNYIQRNHKYKRGGRLNINDNYTNIRTPTSPITSCLYHSEYRMNRL